MNTLLPCPFCGYTLSDHEAVAVVGVHDKCRSCILAGFKVVGYDGPKLWNKRAAPSVVAGVGEHAAGVSVEKDWRDVGESIDAAVGVPSPQVEQVSAVQESFGDEALPASTQGSVETQNTLGVSPTVAVKILAACDALTHFPHDKLADAAQEAYHQLYSIADPSFTSLTPFAELERIAGEITSVGRGNDNHLAAPIPHKTAPSPVPLASEVVEEKKQDLGEPGAVEK